MHGPLIERLHKIVKGIDADECNDPEGWWETSTGAEFGTGKLAELDALIAELTTAGNRFAAVADPLLGDEVSHFPSAWEIDPHHGLDGEKLAEELTVALAAWRALVGDDQP